MSENYPNAARRHLEDSHTLLDAGRWDNSAYLAGYVVECSLKAVITHPAAPPDVDVKEIGHNISKLAAILDSMAAARFAGNRRSVDSRLVSKLRSEMTVHVAWSPAMRYEDSGKIAGPAAHKWWRLANGAFNGLAKDLCAGETK
jgi:HEPN domain-containing protein